MDSRARRRWRVAVAAVLVAAAARVWVLGRYRVHGICMAPAIPDGGGLWVNKLAYRIRPPARGDVVAYRREGKVWISRILATGGSRVEIQHERIFVDGNCLPDDPRRTWDGWHRGGMCGVGGTFQVPPGRLYVLSDNLGATADDSRAFGPIPVGDVIGRAIGY